MKQNIARQTLTLLQHYIDALGFKPVVHFELEGCYAFPANTNQQKLDFSAVNTILSSLNIAGELIPEYWRNQWEYVSKFNGQSPVEEADNLAEVIKKLPAIFALQGVSETLIKPVVWSGDKGKLASNCENVFTADSRSVHIPNAVQINVSVLNRNKENLVANTEFGQYLQQSFIKRSLACCLLYLPEEEAFERLALKTRFGLAQELCSPVNISGGHQGSIALYKELGKHNQAMGVKTLLVDKYNKVLASESHWQETARVEHRLGASSVHYCPYTNLVFALLNVIDALHTFRNDRPLDELLPDVLLPTSLKNDEHSQGAITIFERDNWFNQRINEVQQTFINELDMTVADKKLFREFPENLGDVLKKSILDKYQQRHEIIFTQ